MDKISETFANAYRSKRLVYRAISKSDEDKGWVHKFGAANPVLNGLGNPELFRDTDKKSSFQHIEKDLDALLLAVFICLPAEETPEEAAEFASLGLGENAARIRDKATPIGSLMLSPQRGVQAHARFTSIGLSIGEDHQNKGYGSEAINWVLDWAFKYANVHKVEIGAVSYNDRAAHLYEKLGFKPEGRRRHVVFVNRQWYDIIEFGMLEDEWEALRQQKGSD